MYKRRKWFKGANKIIQSKPLAKENKQDEKKNKTFGRLRRVPNVVETLLTVPELCDHPGLFMGFIVLSWSSLCCALYNFLCRLSVFFADLLAFYLWFFSFNNPLVSSASLLICISIDVYSRRLRRAKCAGGNDKNGGYGLVLSYQI